MIRHEGEEPLDFTVAAIIGTDADAPAFEQSRREDGTLLEPNSSDVSRLVTIALREIQVAGDETEINPETQAALIILHEFVSPDSAALDPETEQSFAELTGFVLNIGLEDGDAYQEVIDRAEEIADAPEELDPRRIAEKVGLCLEGFLQVALAAMIEYKIDEGISPNTVQAQRGLGLTKSRALEMLGELNDLKFLQLMSKKFEL